MSPRTLMSEKSILNLLSSVAILKNIKPRGKWNEGRLSFGFAWLAQVMWLTLAGRGQCGWFCRRWRRGSCSHPTCSCWSAGREWAESDLQRHTYTHCAYGKMAVLSARHKRRIWGCYSAASGVKSELLITTDLHHQTTTRHQWFLCPVSSWTADWSPKGAGPPDLEEIWSLTQTTWQVREMVLQPLTWCIVLNENEPVGHTNAHLTHLPLMMIGLLWLLVVFEGQESESVCTLTEIITSLFPLGGFSLDESRSSMETDSILFCVV